MQKYVNFIVVIHKHSYLYVHVYLFKYEMYELKTQQINNLKNLLKYNLTQNLSQIRTEMNEN